jgi:hypothetical protein
MNRGKGIGLIAGMVIGLLINVAGFFAFDLVLMARGYDWLRNTRLGL